MNKKILTCLALLFCSKFLFAQTVSDSKIESNVIYGMHGGLALLMDVYQPKNLNGYGIIVIPGSGWHQPLSYDAKPLNSNLWYLSKVIGSDVLLKNGYTLFVINHRSAPVFRFPAAVDDAQRAVQFIRHNASRFNIDSVKIGALGHSSGAHLVNMLGTMDDIKDVDSESTVSRQSSKVQAVVSLSAPTDLKKFATENEGDAGAISSFLGLHIMSFWGPNHPVKEELSLFDKASPKTHVTQDDCPFLIVHGDKDPIVPYSQAKVFENALTENQVPTKLILVEDGGHIFEVGNSKEIKSDTYFDEIINLFDLHLRNSKE
ncbi:MAG: hypothetical protein CMO01_13665 [Thalassobius sp.]|nr:hypothetical protein [Thalassovita sp.]